MVTRQWLSHVFGFPQFPNPNSTLSITKCDVRPTLGRCTAGPQKQQSAKNRNYTWLILNIGASQFVPRKNPNSWKNCWPNFQFLLHLHHVKIMLKTPKNGKKKKVKKIIVKTFKTLEKLVKLLNCLEIGLIWDEIKVNVESTLKKFVILSISGG